MKTIPNKMGSSHGRFSPRVNADEHAPALQERSAGPQIKRRRSTSASGLKEACRPGGQSEAEGGAEAQQGGNRMRLGDTHRDEQEEGLLESFWEL